MKIFHIITGLSTGGAETTLLKLSERMKDRHEIIVVSLLSHGEIGPELEKAGIPVYALGMKRGIPTRRGVARLIALIKEANPDLVQTWLYHGDLIGGYAARKAGVRHIVWNVRHTNLDRNANKRTTLWTAKLCAKASWRTPEVIVSCSDVARKRHIDYGYAPEKFEVIPNGYDISKFQPDAEARRQIRLELGIDEADPVVGMVGRFHAQKDHRTFVEAAKLLLKSLPQAKFVLCGQGVDQENAEMMGWIGEAADSFRLLGRRDDIPALNASFDIATISSIGEGFPNVVGEAMACGTPCVVTDVGDAAYLVGETGEVSPPSNPESLARGWKKLLSLPDEEKKALGSAARERVLLNFTLDKVVLQYEQLYARLYAG